MQTGLALTYASPNGRRGASRATQVVSLSFGGNGQASDEAMIRGDRQAARMAGADSPSLRRGRLVRTAPESDGRARPSRRTRAWGCSGRRTGPAILSGFVNGRRRALFWGPSPAPTTGSCSCRAKQQTERDQRVHGVAELGADSPTHGRCRKIGCAGGDGGVGRRGGIASMVLFGRRCGWAAGHSEKKGRSNKGAIFGFFDGDCFFCSDSTVKTQISF